MDEWIDGWMVGWLAAWLVGWLDGWLDGWMDGCNANVYMFVERNRETRNVCLHTRRGVKYSSTIIQSTRLYAAETHF